MLRAGATPAQVIEASGVIEEAGFTIIDDLLHGYGGGYLPPVLGCQSRPAGPVPQEPFRAGQTVVIQPNVTTRDGKAGVQTGEMVVITAIRHRAAARHPARVYYNLNAGRCDVGWGQTNFRGAGGGRRPRG